MSETVRPVNDAVVSALDAALGAHGEVVHTVDPARAARFVSGGPPVWSVGVIEVTSDRPYWLWLTFGFSGTVTPVSYREPYQHEYAIAVPRAGQEEPPSWPPALLLHLSSYVLDSGAELRVGDTIPCHAPLPVLPFAPEQHAALPSTELDTLLVADDPLLGTIETPRGPVEVRRLVGVHPRELELLERWSSASFLEEMRADDPGLLTDIARDSLLADAAFAARAEARAQEEGSSVGVLFIEGGWMPSEEGGIDLRFPGRGHATRIRRALHARLPYGRPLILRGPPHVGGVVFEPDARFGIGIEDDLLFFRGSLEDPQLQQLLAVLLDEEQDVTRLHMD